MPTLFVHIPGRSKPLAVRSSGAALLSDTLAGGEWYVEQPCGGHGTCGRCRIRVLSGDVTPPSPAEQDCLPADALAAGVRLACQTRLHGDATVAITVPDAEPARRALHRHTDDLPDGPLGLGIDLGTTTVGAVIADTATGTPALASLATNRQLGLGADVISRLNRAADEPGGGRTRELQALARLSIQEAIAGLALPESAVERLAEVVIVGNTAMHHLLLGCPVHTLHRAPFEPAPAETWGSIAPDGWIPEAPAIRFVPPLGGYVGSDALACLVACNFDRAAVPQAALDLGTNGEVMVTDGERVLVTSAAAGPAFEGGNITCGMRARAGAITAVHLDDAGLRCDVLGDTQRPIGLAGSGLLSVTRALRECDVIRYTGYLEKTSPHPAITVVQDEGGRRVHLAENVWLSQADIREYQKAKAAIRAALDTLLAHLGLAPDDVQRFWVTGAFGAHLVPDDLLALGMIPSVPRERVTALDDGAACGAALLLTDDGRAREQYLRERTTHYSLHADPSFDQRYIDALFLS